MAKFIRVLALLLLGMLAFLLGYRLYAAKGRPESQPPRAVQCSGCPLSGECGKAGAEGQEKQP